MNNRYDTKHIAKCHVTEGDRETAIKELMGMDFGKWNVRDIEIIDITYAASYVARLNDNRAKYGSPPEPPPVTLSEPVDIYFNDRDGNIWTLADRIAFRDLTKRVVAIEKTLKGQMG